MADIPVKCTRCRHQCLESQWLDKPTKKYGGDITAYEKVCPKCRCTSYFDMRPQVAWCWASGLIEFGTSTPTGAMPIARGPKSFLKAVVSTRARRGQGDSTGKLLVPGVPEAAGQSEGAAALDAWLKWCAKGNGKKGLHGTVFLHG